MFRTKLQERYELLDAQFYDDGVTSPKVAEWINGNSTMSVDSTGTTISATGFSTNWANKPNTSSSEFDYTGNNCIEFDLVENSDESNIQFQFYDGTNVGVIYIRPSQTGHWKLVFNGETIVPYLDGVKLTDVVPTTPITGAYRIGFRVHSGYSIKFKEFVIYSI